LTRKSILFAGFSTVVAYVSGHPVEAETACIRSTTSSRTFAKETEDELHLCFIFH